MQIVDLNKSSHKRKHTNQKGTKNHHNFQGTMLPIDSRYFEATDDPAVQGNVQYMTHLPVTSSLLSEIPKFSRSGKMQKTYQSGDHSSNEKSKGSRKLRIVLKDLYKQENNHR